MKLSCQSWSFISPQRVTNVNLSQIQRALWPLKVCLLHDFCIEVHAGIWGHKRAKVWKRRFNAGRESAAGGESFRTVRWSRAEVVTFTCYDGVLLCVYLNGKVDQSELGSTVWRLRCCNDLTYVMWYSLGKNWNQVQSSKGWHLFLH